jgi:hypothetical protein
MHFHSLESELILIQAGNLQTQVARSLLLETLVVTVTV